MKKVFGFMCSALIAGTAAFAAPAFAEEAKPAGLKPDDVKSALGLSVYVQGGYTYNGKASATASGSGENDLRWLDHKANSFTLDLAQLVFFKDAATGAAGYKLKLSAGEYAKLIHASGLGTQPTGTANPESIDVTEAFISYIAPLGKGLRFDLGKMGTFIGAEVLEAKDNPNYSRSFLFSFAEPLTHTGLKVSYPFADMVSGAVFVVNGWDNAVDNNKSKSLGVSIGLTPSDMISGYINYITGPENTDNNRDSRSLLDLVAVIKPTKQLSIILNYDNGAEDMGAGASDVKWSGVSGIVKFDINDTYSVSVRGESFDDKDGVRTGTKQKLTEVTLTPEIRLGNGMIVRPEYRHDSSDKESFENGTKKKQDTIALGVMYAW